MVEVDWTGKASGPRRVKYYRCVQVGGRLICKVSSTTLRAINAVEGGHWVALHRSQFPRYIFLRNHVGYGLKVLILADNHTSTIGLPQNVQHGSSRVPDGDRERNESGLHETKIDGKIRHCVWVGDQQLAEILGPEMHVPVLTRSATTG